MFRKLYKYLALGGVAGPLVFIIMTVYAGNLRIGYSHFQQFISELGASSTPNAQLMNNVGFIPSGLLIAVFGVSLLMLLPKRKLALFGSVMIICFGTGILVSGFITCDAGCPVFGSTENFVHNGISTLAFLMAILGVGVLGFSFKTNSSFHLFWKYSVVSSIFSFVFLLAMFASLQSRTYTGLFQRLLLFTLFLWCVVVAIQLYRNKNVRSESKDYTTY